MVHRLLASYLRGEASVDQNTFEKKCKHSSNMEYLATQAERDSIKYMQIKFMQNHNNKSYKGVISGVTEWGIYIEIIENKCEGMVYVKDIKDDKYYYSSEEASLIGKKNKKKFQLGDSIKVEVKNADLIKKHLDFIII